MTYPYLDVRLNCNVRTDHEMTPEELLIGVDRSKNVVIEVRFRDTRRAKTSAFASKPIRPTI